MCGPCRRPTHAGTEGPCRGGGALRARGSGSFDCILSSTGRLRGGRALLGALRLSARTRRRRRTLPRLLPGSAPTEHLRDSRVADETL